nr:Non-structural protein [Tibet orbivirus]
MEHKPRRFTKNIAVLDGSRTTICGQISKFANKPYCNISIGRNVSVKAVDNPLPKGYVLQIKQEGAYRIQDGQDTISLMITASGVEATVERWEEWQFEVLSAMPMAIMMQHNGEMVDAEIKYAKGMGVVAPYVRNEVDRRDLPKLPGLSESQYDVKTLRQKIKEEREKGVTEIRSKVPSLERESKQMESVEKSFAEMRAIWAAESKANAKEGGVDGAFGTEFFKPYPSESTKLPEFKSLEQREPLKERDQPKTQNFSVEAESGSDEEVEEPNYITEEYVEKTSKVIKSGDKKIAGLAYIMPRSVGDFSNIVAVKKHKWANVPLFSVDEKGLKYEFQAVGECETVVYAARGMNLLVLPVGI